MENKPFHIFDRLNDYATLHDGGFLVGGGILLGLALAIYALVMLNRRLVHYIHGTGALHGQKRRLVLYGRFAFWILTFLLLCVAIAIALQFWWPQSFRWAVRHLDKPMAFVLRQSLILGIFLLAWEACYYFLQRKLLGIGEIYSQRAKTLFPVAINTLAVVMIVLYGLVVLSAIGVDIAPLLTGAGVAGIALGLGAQQTIRDLIAGFTLIIEDLVQVGDIIVIGDHSGVVERITIRKIQLRDLNGAVYTIPYSEIKIIENLTKGFSYHVFEIGVAYDTDIDKAIEVIKEIGQSLQDDQHFGSLVMSPIEVFGVDALQDNAITIKGRIRTQPSQQWAVGREFNRRVKHRFEQEGIVIPFPQRTLHLDGIDKLRDALQNLSEQSDGASSQSRPA